jgi:3'-phosphoadenosine 5'-phosphosulfate sulfotransferase (PAPS reductase)/FAD synthetase
MSKKKQERRQNTSTLLPLDEYDNIIVSFSGGKDSIACYLHLLDLGVAPERIELWHQCVDGEPGVDERFFDWPCTEAYCQAFADHFGSRLLFQWKVKGFQGEMLRDDSPTQLTGIQMLDGSVKYIGKGEKGKRDTRLKFPQVSADLRTRWCSAYLKIDVASKVFTNDPRFNHANTVMLTGERREESAARDKYATVDKHKGTPKNPDSPLRRRVDQWRAVIEWTEQEVWEIIERYRVRPHPAYYLGWSRVSCFPCIFGNPDQWASVRHIDPALFQKILDYEQLFGVTLRRDGPLSKSADKGTSYLQQKEPKRRNPAGAQLGLFDRPTKSAMQMHLEDAMSERYTRSIIVPTSEEWKLPRGAFGHSGGPT